MSLLGRITRWNNEIINNYTKLGTWFNDQSNSIATQGNRGPFPMILCIYSWGGDKDNTNDLMIIIIIVRNLYYKTHASPPHTPRKSDSDMTHSPRRTRSVMMVWGGGESRERHQETKGLWENNFCLLKNWRTYFSNKTDTRTKHRHSLLIFLRDFCYNFCSHNVDIRFLWHCHATWRHITPANSIHMDVQTMYFLSVSHVNQSINQSVSQQESRRRRLGRGVSTSPFSVSPH